MKQVSQNINYTAHAWLIYMSMSSNIQSADISFSRQTYERIWFGNMRRNSVARAPLLCNGHNHGAKDEMQMVRFSR